MSVSVIARSSFYEVPTKVRPRYETHIRLNPYCPTRDSIHEGEREVCYYIATVTLALAHKALASAVVGRRGRRGTRGEGRHGWDEAPLNVIWS